MSNLKIINKRGLSTIITTLIVILLTLVAVGIVWVVIKNMITSGTEEIELGKFSVDMEIKNVQVSASDIALDVRRNIGKGDISAIKFVFSDSSSSKVIERATSIGELGQERFIFNFTEINNTIIKEIAIVPVFKTSSGKTSLGNQLDSYIIPIMITGKEMIISSENRNFGSSVGNWNIVDYYPPNDETFSWESTNIGGHIGVGKWTAGSIADTYYANLLPTFINNLTPYTNYNFSFNFYRPSGTANTLLRAFVYPNSTNEILTFNATNIPVDIWVAYSGTFNSGGENSLRLAPHIYSSNPGENFYIDDVSVKEII